MSAPDAFKYNMQKKNFLTTLNKTRKNQFPLIQNRLQSTSPTGLFLADTIMITVWSASYCFRLLRAIGIRAYIKGEKDALMGRIRSAIHIGTASGRYTPNRLSS
jgi:hypothetical protein